MNSLNEHTRERIIGHNILLGLPIPGCDDSTNTWNYQQSAELNITEDIVSKQNQTRSLLIKQMFDKTNLIFIEEPKTLNTAAEPKVSIELATSQFELNEEILAFSSKHGILAYITEVLTLLENSFTLIESINVKIVEDPEVGEEWLSFEVSVHGEVEEVLESYDKYVTQFVSKVPWPECDKIRLSYFII